jgi:hypothetical protein
MRQEMWVTRKRMKGGPNIANPICSLSAITMSMAMSLGQLAAA